MFSSFKNKHLKLIFIIGFISFLYSCGPKRLGCGPGRCYNFEKVEAINTTFYTVSILDI
jgi:hypothetical protein